MGARRLVEQTREMVISYIQENIPIALSHMRDDRGDSKVTTEPPRKYFIYPKAKGYEPPVVFVIAEEFDFRPAAKGANHINAKGHFVVAVVVEDRDAERLTLKSERYFDAMHEVLAQAEIVDQVKNVKIVVIVTRGTFSPQYSNAGDGVQGMFRKEIHLDCEVEHYSSF